ncbi:MAG: NTP transferase domain-containing protein [Pirellulales bacterium]
MQRIGVLLAAGESRRFGRPKQLLPWPPNSENTKSLVAAAFDAIARVCDEMFVVLGHEADDVMSALAGRKFRYYQFGEPGSMFRSTIVGLAVGRLRCDELFEVPTQLLLHLSDHPQVRLDTLQSLIAAANEQPDVAVIPQYRGRGGHPVLIPHCVAKLICGFHGRGGLRQFWVEHPQLCVRLPVDDPGVVFDVDTQADYDFYSAS